MSVVLRVIGVVGLLLICVAVVATAANTVPASNVGSSSTAITANTLKPAACNGITLTNLVIGNNGTAANDLVLGSAGLLLALLGLAAYGLGLFYLVPAGVALAAGAITSREPVERSRVGSPR